MTGVVSSRDWLFHCGLKRSLTVSSRDKPSSWLCYCFISILHLTPTPSAKVPGTQRVAGAGFVLRLLSPELLLQPSRFAPRRAGEKFSDGIPFISSTTLRRSVEFCRIPSLDRFSLMC